MDHLHPSASIADRRTITPLALAPFIDDPALLRRLPLETLPLIADQVRDLMLDSVSKTGGHLGSGLGMVELTVALHYVFDTPIDKIVFDVSHQCYPHKILTGRRAQMDSIRQDGGLAGFTCRQESPFDPFGAAHSSTAISAALGFATARDLAGRDEAVIAVTGDGALSGGLSYEGLNNCGAQKRRVIIVINDNDMSIAPPSGALADHLRALRAAMPDAATRHAALSSALAEPGLRGDEKGPPSFYDGATLFDALGCRYCGPFDGHDVGEMVQALRAAADVDGPIVIHALTNKGHGYGPAEAAADKYHGVAKFDRESGQQKKPAPKAPSYTGVFAKTLTTLAETDPSIVAITAAMPSGTGLDTFGARFPDRCFDTGIAEQHAVTFGAAMAAEGYRPFAAIYSTFLQRAYDQIVHDVAIQKLPVRFAIDRAGMVGADGVTHQGSYDVAYLGCLPHFVLMAAGDEAELVRMIATAAAIDDRPSAVRYPRGEGTGVALPERLDPLDIGRGRIVRSGSDVALLSYGATLSAALTAADRLESQSGLSVTVADARFAKPLDGDLLKQLFDHHAGVVVIEEGAIGGFGTHVARWQECHGRALRPKRCLHLPDAFIEHGSRTAQLERAQLSAAHIEAAACDLVRCDDGRRLV